MSRGEHWDLVDLEACLDDVRLPAWKPSIQEPVLTTRHMGKAARHMVLFVSAPFAQGVLSSCTRSTGDLWTAPLSPLSAGFIESDSLRPGTSVTKLGAVPTGRSSGDLDPYS